MLEDWPEPFRSWFEKLLQDKDFIVKVYERDGAIAISLKKEKNGKLLDPKIEIW